MPPTETSGTASAFASLILAVCSSIWRSSTCTSTFDRAAKFGRRLRGHQRAARERVGERPGCIGGLCEQGVQFSAGCRRLGLALTSSFSALASVVFDEVRSYW